MNNTTSDIPPRIVSIQSQLIYGCAGNIAAVPLLQAMGADVYAVPTVLMSNTPNYDTVAAHDFPITTIEKLLQTLLDRVPPDALDGILVGYINQPEMVSIIAAFIDRVRRLNPSIVVVIDPVMGDSDRGMYLPAAVTERICTELVPRADICTPNLFEARVITGLMDQSRSEVLDRLSELDVPVMLATGIGLESPGAPVLTRVWHANESWGVTTPHINIRPSGTGDLLSAAFLFLWLQRRPVQSALRGSVAIVHTLLRDAAGRKLTELQPWRARMPADSDLDEYCLTRIEAT